MKVVLTGKFNHGSRKQVAELLAQQGIEVAKGLSTTVDYLINGSLGSDAYSKGQYGSKHIKATQLGVAIVSEDEFFAQLEKGSVSADQMTNVDMNVAQADLEKDMPTRKAGQDKLQWTRIPGLELTIRYTNAKGELTTRKIGAISINLDAPYFYARSPGETQSRGFRYDRISDAVDNTSGEVVDNIEEYMKGLFGVGDEIRDIKRRAGMTEGIFGDYKKSWKITGALLTARELGFDILTMIEKNKEMKNHYYVKNAEMIDDLDIRTEAELATMLIIPYLERVNDPEHVAQLGHWVMDQATKGKISQKFGMNFLKELGVTPGQ